jgi:hypothetical protein
MLELAGSKIAHPEGESLPTGLRTPDGWQKAVLQRPVRLSEPFVVSGSPTTMSTEHVERAVAATTAATSSNDPSCRIWGSGRGADPTETASPTRRRP